MVEEKNQDGNEFIISSSIIVVLEWFPAKP